MTALFALGFGSEVLPLIASAFFVLCIIKGLVDRLTERVKARRERKRQASCPDAGGSIRPTE